MLLSLSKLIGSAISVLILSTEEAEEGVMAVEFVGEFADTATFSASAAFSPIGTGLGDCVDKRILLLRSHFC